MKAILASLALLLTASIASAASAAWSTDLEAAFAKAKQQNKPVLVEFTGSDWCPPCIKMRKNVFSKKSFTDAASADYILVELDFPQKNTAVREKNAPYADKFGIEVFPTVILFDSKGKESSRFTAIAYPSVDKLLAHIKAVKP